MVLIKSLRTCKEYLICVVNGVPRGCGFFSTMRGSAGSYLAMRVRPANCGSLGRSVLTVKPGGAIYSN